MTDSASPNKGVGLSVNINMYVYVYTCFSRPNFLESTDRIPSEQSSTANPGSSMSACLFVSIGAGLSVNMCMYVWM